MRPAPRNHTIVRWYMLLRSLDLVVRHLGLGVDGSEGRIEDQLLAVRLVEVEHVGDRAGGGVERAFTDTLGDGLLAGSGGQPVVLDELRDRGLRDQRVADVVLLGVGRDHQEGLTRTRTATA